MKICLHCGFRFESGGWRCPTCGREPSLQHGIRAFAPELASSDIGFKSEYYSQLFRLEAQNFWFRARTRVILWALQTYVSHTASLFELGCGTGYVLSNVASVRSDLEVSAGDLFYSGLRYAAMRCPSARIFQMDARQVPFFEEFDAVGAFDVLEHIDDDVSVLGQLHRTLKPGGILLITVPQHPWLWSRADEYACHVRRYTKIEIESKVLHAGFKILRSTSFVTTSLPAMFLSRIFQRKTERFDPSQELNVNVTLNWLFYNLMCLDIFFIVRGINLPFGGSRLIVATK
jgi:SAM-dependent methyltransferase